MGFELIPDILRSNTLCKAAVSCSLVLIDMWRIFAFDFGAVWKMPRFVRCLRYSCKDRQRGHPAAPMKVFVAACVACVACVEGETMKEMNTQCVICMGGDTRLRNAAKF